MPDYTNLRIRTTTHSHGKALKREGETWDALLERAFEALEQAESTSGHSDACNSQADIPDNLLTTDCIDDIADAVANKTATELESRRR